VKYDGTYVDSKLLTVTDKLLHSLANRDVYISVNSDLDILGRSWEMACVMASHGLGNKKSYTGKVKFVTPWGVKFDNVAGEFVKESMIPDLITADDMPVISVQASHS